MGLNSLIVDFSKTYREDEDLVGKKAHELGRLWKLGIPLPKGFVITTRFYKEFLRRTGLDKEIKKTQDLSHPALTDSFEKLFQPIRELINKRPMSQDLTSKLHKSYRKLSGILRDRSLDIFSSSFNNKSIVFNNVKGDANLIQKIKIIWSLSFAEPVAIVVREAIKSEIIGKIFTNKPVADGRLTLRQVDKLANYCKIIQKHFYFPKEIEFVVSKGEIFITRVMPFTGIADGFSTKSTGHKKSRRILTRGISINSGIATGPVRVLRNKHSNTVVKKEEIIVASDLDQALFRKIRNAKAVVVNSILPNSLNKNIYKRYFQVPIVIGAKNAEKILHNGNVVTVNGATGEIYSGGLV